MSIRKAVILALFVAAPAAAVEISRGAAPAEIVVPANAGVVERFAAEELARYLERITGRRLTVREEGAATAAQQIRVGISPEASRLGEDGFVLRSDGPRFFIAGQNARGTLYGVYALLEGLGCRWPEPGSAAEVVPRLPRVDLKGIRDQQAPDLPHRCLRVRYWGDPANPVGEKDYIDWQAKQRMNYLYWIGGDEADTAESVETSLKPFRASDLLQFVRQRGFIIDQSGHSFHRFGGKDPLSFAEKDSEDLVVRNITAYLDANPFLDYLGLWPSDGWGGFVKSGTAHSPLDDPKRVITKDIDFRADEPKAAFTNSYVDFVTRVERRVRERHPRVHLTMLSYNRALLPPDKVKCAPGQQVHIAFRRSYSFSMGDARSAWNRAQVPMLKDWIRACGHVVLYEYYHTGNLGSAGRPLPRMIAQDLRFLKEVGAAGTASQSDGRLFRVHGPNYYTYAKLAWNTRADVEQVLADYYRHTYGPAARAAQDLFDAWEAQWNKGGDYFRYDWAAIVPLFPKAVRAGLLQKAARVVAQAASAEAKVRARAQELRTVMEFFDTYIRFVETKDPATRATLERMAKQYSFIEYNRRALDNAAKWHLEGR